MALLPALADADLAGFGRALSEVQEITGRWFASVQGGTYAPGASAELVRRLREWGASGVGQSSWGPAVYGIVDGEEAGGRLADRAREAMGSSGSVFAGAVPIRRRPGVARGRSRTHTARKVARDSMKHAFITHRASCVPRQPHSRSHARSISRRSTRARRSASSPATCTTRAWTTTSRCSWSRRTASSSSSRSAPSSRLGSKASSPAIQGARQVRHLQPLALGPRVGRGGVRRYGAHHRPRGVARSCWRCRRRRRRCRRTRARRTPTATDASSERSARASQGAVRPLRRRRRRRVERRRSRRAAR